MNIKSEPISPPRDSHTPSSQHMRPPSTGHPSQQGQLSGQVSPNPLSHSNSSSPIAHDFDGPSAAKRVRIGDGWPAS
jgi:hypothetical protein